MARRVEGARRHRTASEGTDSPRLCAAEISAQGDVLPRAGFRAPGFAGLFVGKVEQSRRDGQSYFVCSEAQLPAVRFDGTHGAKKNISGSA